MTEQLMCLNCGVSIYAEDGGLCEACAREVHGPEPEAPEYCSECHAAIVAVAGILPMGTLRVCPRCQADELDRLLHPPEPLEVPSPVAEQPALEGKNGDRRFTMGLLYDVLQVLDKHGYQRAEESRHLARTLEQLLHVVEAYEGKERPR